MVPLCSGIVTAMLWAPGHTITILLMVIALIGLLFSIRYNDRLSNHLFGFSIFTAFFSCGLLLYNNEKNSLSNLEPVQSAFVSTLSDFPAEKENTFMLTLKLSSVISGKKSERIRGSVILYHRKDSLVRKMVPGDILIVRFTPLEIVNRGNPDEFDYKTYMASKGIKYYAFTGRQNILRYSVPTHRNIIHTALIIREKIIDMYRERGVTKERLPLVSAITLGQKNLLDPEIKQVFINAGIMHIMAVSGLHAVILSLFIFNVLFFLKGKFNILRIVITLVILWSFAFVTGLTPSVMRATLMFTFLQAGALLNRRVNGINSVLASAFVLILFRPSIIADAGFLLSYAAVIYIIGFYNDFYLKIPEHSWLPDKIWQMVIITIVAQAGTLPLTILLFNRFPVYFILTNVIIVPLSNLLIILGCLVPLTYSFVSVSEFLASILDKLTGLVEKLTGYAASLPYSTIDMIGMTPVECISLSVAISLLMIFMAKKHRISFRFPLVAFIIFALALNIKKLNNSKSDELIVYNNPSFAATGIRTGNTLYLHSLNDSIPGEVARHAATRALKIKHIKNDYRPLLIKTNNRKILVTDSLSKRFLEENKINILILTGRRPWIEQNIPYGDFPDIIINSSETASGLRFPLPVRDIKNKTIWSVRLSGAYKCGLSD
jgi:competence protein ComEC